MQNTKKVVTMRPYQLECKEAIEQSAPGRHLAGLATGLGKTVVFTHLEGMGRTLLLSHRDELVRQPEKYYDENVTFGVEKANERATDEDIVSASVQTLTQDSRLNRFGPDDFETIIVDEAHHAAAKSYKKILDHFSGAKRIIGFTATPQRGDKVTLSDVFDDIIFSRDIKWGIQNEYLSNIRCIQVRANYSLQDVPVVTGDYSASSIETAMRRAQTIPIAAKAYLKHCHNTGRHTLVYCVTKNICEIMMNTIRKMLPEEECDTIQMVTGDTPAEERAKILQDFSDGKVRAIINCMVLTEGTDLPICDAILNLRPTCNNSLYQQMAGRGTRLYPGKEYCLLVDIIPEDFDIQKRQLCTAPSLFGIDASLLDKKEAKKLNEQTDLLVQCAEWSGEFADAAAKLKLAIRNVDLFMDEREEMIRMNIGNPRQLESKYNSFVDKKNDTGDLDFGNLAVTVNADCNRKYEIHPTWDETIYLSEPDVLNNVSVTLCLTTMPDCFKTASAINIPFEKAKDFVETYCKTQPDYYAYAWDKNMQEAWKKLPATDKQIKKITQMYKKYKLQPNSKQLKQLSKLGASRLIDLAFQLKDADKQRDLLKKIANPPKRKKKTDVELPTINDLDDIIGAPSHDPKQEKECTDRFYVFYKNIQNRYKKDQVQLQKLRDANQERLNQLKAKHLFSVSVDYFSGPNRRASAAQIGFIESLERQLKPQNLTFAGVRPSYLTSRQASAIIAAFSKLKDESWIHDLTFTNFYDVCRGMETVPTSMAVFTIK